MNSAKQLTDLLVDHGVRVARKRNTYSLLSRYFEDAQDVDRLITLVSTCGWHGENQAFVMPGETIGDQNYRLECECEELGAVESAEDWRHHVASLCAGNSRLVLSVSLAFCGPILGLLKRESFGLHLQGTSSEGKSTVGVYLVGSVWGEPEKFKTTWLATANGLEGKAAELNHLLLALDELAQIEPEEAVKAIYTIGGGTGKVRGREDGRTRKQFHWTLLFISTGELSLADHVSSSGQSYFAGLDVSLFRFQPTQESTWVFSKTFRDLRTAMRSLAI